MLERSATRPQASEPVNGDDAMDVEEDSAVQRFAQFSSIREICADFDLEEEWAVISRIMGHRLLQSGNLGIASTVYAAADDTYGLSRIADKLLDLYVEQGEEAFLEQIEEMPPTLLREAEDVKPDIDYARHTVRMVFIAQFRDFVLYKRQEAWDLAARNVVSLIAADSAPLGIRAVLLVEAVQSLEGEQ